MTRGKPPIGGYNRSEETRIATTAPHPTPPFIQRHLSSSTTAPALRHANANAMLPTPVQQEQIRRAN
ncbi:hypothetical protein ACEUCO_00575 [Aeromonas veronii]